MVKFSLIGAGRIAHRHAEHIINNGQLIAVCDNDPKALTNFKKDFPEVNVYSSIEELLACDHESDVVNICTPNGLHCEHAVLAMQSGKHVVVEKPMALNTSDCMRMIAASKMMQRYLFVVKQNRYNPPVIKLKEVLENNLLGNIYSAQLNCFWNRDDAYFAGSNWKGTIELDGGILFTQFSHFIDLFVWVLGNPNSVKAYGNNYNHLKIIEFDDTITSIARFSSGVIGTMNFTINAFRKNMEGSITIFGQKGTLKVGGQYLNELEYQSIDSYTINDLAPGKPSNDYGTYQGSMSNHDKVIENVVDVLERNGKVAVDGYEGIKTVDLIEKIYANIDRGEFVFNNTESLVFETSKIGTINTSTQNVNAIIA